MTQIRIACSDGTWEPLIEDKIRIITAEDKIRIITKEN